MATIRKIGPYNDYWDPITVESDEWHRIQWYVWRLRALQSRLTQLLERGRP